MVSTNHFRGRRLSRTLRAPISPRKPHAEAAAAAPPPPPVGVRWSLTVDNGGGLAEIPEHEAVPTLIAPGEWQELGTAPGVVQYWLQVLFTDEFTPLYFFVYLDQGFGFQFAAEITSFFWDGVTPTVFGPTDWVQDFPPELGNVTASLPFP